jgi:hypothetical protein
MSLDLAWTGLAGQQCALLYFTYPDFGKWRKMNAPNLDLEVKVKKFNPFEAYSLAKAVTPIAGWTKQDWPFGSISWPLYMARAALNQQIGEASIFGSATIRAAANVVSSINQVIPADFQEMTAADPVKVVPRYQLEIIQESVRSLETVMSNDMPGISSYVVSQKGIYKTEDLIEHTDLHFPEDVRKHLPEQARNDLIQAGKCLAFEVPTACTFHLWRAVETVMGSYYVKISGGKTFKDDGVQRNWSAYIQALDKKGADSDITKFLDHIRNEYRNPQTHPDEFVSLNGALGLFAVATSAIQQMVFEIQKN